MKNKKSKEESVPSARRTAKKEEENIVNSTEDKFRNDLDEVIETQIKSQLENEAAFQKKFKTEIEIFQMKLEDIYIEFIEKVGGYLPEVRVFYTPHMKSLHKIIVTPSVHLLKHAKEYYEEFMQKLGDKL